MSASGCAATDAVSSAQRSVRMHRETEALTSLRVHLVRHPDDVSARRLLVRVLAFTGDLEAAKTEVRELERRTPDDPLSWIELGHAFELTHRFDEALEAYDTAAKVAKSSPAGPREGGLRAARWGETEEAVSRLEEAIRRGARDGEVFHALGLARLHQKDFTGAEQAYEQGLSVDPKSTENILGLATVAVVRGDARAALAAYDRLLAHKPGYASAELGRAWAFAKLGRKEDAKRALDRAEALSAPRENVARQRADLK